MSERSGHLQCPFCNSYDVVRLYVASHRLDSCECLSCRACWDEDVRSGEQRTTGDPPSVAARRRR